VALSQTKYAQTITYDTVIDQATADAWVLEIINTVVIKFIKQYQSNDTLTQGMIDALCDFAWGGVGLYKNSSIRTKLAAKDYCGAADGFLLYQYAPLPKGAPDIPGNPPGKQIMKGLQIRRQNERTLFLS
jgi:GH24 family phage-related lysozyme (muramidase)